MSLTPDQQILFNQLKQLSGENQTDIQSSVANEVTRQLQQFKAAMQPAPQVMQPVAQPKINKPEEAAPNGIMSAKMMRDYKKTIMDALTLEQKGKLVTMKMEMAYNSGNPNALEESAPQAVLDFLLSKTGIEWVRIGFDSFQDELKNAIPK